MNLLNRSLELLVFKQLIRRKLKFSSKSKLSKGGIALQVANLPKAESPTVTNGKAPPLSEASVNLKLPKGGIALKGLPCGQSFSILLKFAIRVLVPTLSKEISIIVSLPMGSALITRPMPKTLCFTLSPTL